MLELRAYSTRAHITSTSFVNDYSFGSFKGNADAWMEKYFDSFIYLANWGTRILKLRLPSLLLSLSTAKSYCAGDSLDAREKDGRVILTLQSDYEGGGEWIQGEGWLSWLIPVRDELARGDLRALYLGWLLCAQNDTLAGRETEPPVPPGLGQLSASLERLVEFLRIDSDLLAVAAQASSPLPKTTVEHSEILAWIERLPTGEKNDLFAKLVIGDDSALPAEILRRLLEERDDAVGHEAEAIERRSVNNLLHAAEKHGAELRRIAAQEQADEEARKEREATEARAKHLEALSGREPELWLEVERLISSKQLGSYGQAVELLKDLRDLAAGKKEIDFHLRFESLRMAHTRKPALMDRLRKAGLWHQ